MATKMLKVILLLLIISSTLIDARSRRKRRQVSGSSSYSATVPFTYPSGSFYSAPGYGYTNGAYSSDLPYDTNYRVTGVDPYGVPVTYNTQYSYGTGTPYQFPNLGSTYGSGLWGFSIPGFNNQYPNWNQGNSHQYFTGGTGTGLTNNGYYWFRRSQPIPFGDQPVPNVEGIPLNQNQPISTANRPPGK
ncbi:unnamed protein product [Adineta ricciae]|uniref:Uncharacterized protein n=1 Tax=Adineta ricciae TaxID=249248 RepID=A0A816H3Y1_ADIRI|nr:unnamed protein product [Adineta ricciae]